MADPTISPPELLSLPVPDHSRRQLEALLDVSKIIAQHRDLKTLFHELADRLQPVVESDFLALVLHDSSKNVMRLHVLETREEHHKPVGTETPVDGNPSGWVWQTQQPFISDDILTESRFPEFLPRLARIRRSFFRHSSAHHRATPPRRHRLRPPVAQSDFRFGHQIHATRCRASRRRRGQCA